MHSWNPFNQKVFNQGRSWEQPDPEALILLIHGIGEHVDRYQDTAQFFLKNGFSIFAPDLPGHGKAPGKRGHLPPLHLLRSGISELIQTIQDRYPKKPIILYGHSMGGNLVLNYGTCVQNEHLKGIIATSPWLKLPNPPPLLLRNLAHIMASIYPAFTQKTKLDASGLSNDPGVVEAYIKDPLVHDQITASTYTNLANSAKFLLSARQFPKPPVLLMHGLEDTITDPQGSTAYCELPGNHAHFKSWPGFRHEIHQEAGKEAVFRYMIEWITRHLPDF